METPHDPRYDEIELIVDELFNATDLAIYALYNKIIDATHEEQ